MPSKEDVDQQFKLLGILRRRLAVLLSQQKQLGVFAPPYIVTEIDQARADIARIKGILRGWSVPFDDHPDDEEVSQAPVVVQPSKPVAVQQPSQPQQTTASRASDQESVDGLSYDVFISYHDVDEEWVGGQLLPLLENAGLNVLIGYRDFELGVPRLVNIERAVDNSRHTLIVMTPEWVEGEWENFHALLAGSADPKGVRQKLIPLKLKPCDPPSRIAMLEAVDLTRQRFRDTQLDRLVRTLGSSADAATVARSVRQEQPPENQVDDRPSKVALPEMPPIDAGPVDFVIVTALEEERDAVLAKLPGYRRLAPSDTDIRVYYSASISATFDDGSVGAYRVVVLTLLGMGRVQATTATSDAIRRWKPRYVMLVGIAGGIAGQDVNVGDILVSDQIVDYELQKITAEGPQIRWEVHRASPRLVAAASDFGFARWKELVAAERPGEGVPISPISESVSAKG